MSHRCSQDMLPTRNIIKPITFFETCAPDDHHKALEEHPGTNLMHQYDLDKCVLYELQIVLRKKKALSNVAPALTAFLQSGAKWISYALLDGQKTPYHIICESTGDHHELLDLMIKSSHQTIINARDVRRHTALMYAVENTNINCVKCLIANGADVTIGNHSYLSFGSRVPLAPILKTICMLTSASKYSSVIISDIFDLLVDAAVDQNKAHFKSCKEYILCALRAGNIHCINKLIMRGAPLDIIASNGVYVWELIAKKGDVKLLKSMFSNGIDKDSTGQHYFSILTHVVNSGNIEAVRFLLDLGVTIPNYTRDIQSIHCDHCNENTLIIDEYDRQEDRDPCMTSICNNKLDMVKLLDQYGSQSVKSFTALRRAVVYGRVDVVSYLLNKHTYTLDIEYLLTKMFDERKFTLLSECLIHRKSQMSKLLLDHGADPAKPMCESSCANPIMIAIFYGYLKDIAQYIRSGANVNFRSRVPKHKKMVSPFEASVLHNHPFVSIMLLISGCSSVVSNTRKFKVKPRLEKLIKEWNVNVNNMTPLKQRCRSVILNHLFPRADMKIWKLPLPPCLIKFLSIPELDEIVYKYG